METKTQCEIIKLLEGLESGDINALGELWRSVEFKQTPKIEPIDGDNENMLVTVVWKDAGDTNKVSVIGEFFGFNTDENILNRIQTTDVWYRSFACPKDVRSLYCFTINDDDVDDWDDIDKRVDPYNSKQYIFPRDEEHPEKCALFAR